MMKIRVKLSYAHFSAGVLADFLNSKDPYSGLIAGIKRLRPNSWEGFWMACETINFPKSRRITLRVQKDLRTDLMNFLEGDREGITTLCENVNSLAPRQSFAIYEAEDRDPKKQVLIGPHPYKRNRFECRNIRLGGKNFLVTTPVDHALSFRSFIYGLLRNSIVYGNIERLGVCSQCQIFTAYLTKKKDFCSDQCRWNFHNKREDRRMYIKSLRSGKRKRKIRSELELKISEKTLGKKLRQRQ